MRGGFGEGGSDIDVAKTSGGGEGDDGRRTESDCQKEQGSAGHPGTARVPLFVLTSCVHKQLTSTLTRALCTCLSLFTDRSGGALSFAHVTHLPG